MNPLHSDETGAVSILSLIPQELQSAPVAAPPKPVMRLAGGAVVCAVIGVGSMIVGALLLVDYNGNNAASVAVGALLVAGSMYPLLPVVKAFAAAKHRSNALRDSQAVPARRAAAAGREAALTAMGYAAAVAIVGLLLIAALANKREGIASHYFTLQAWQLAFPEMIRAFWTNIWVAIVAQVIVLIVGLLVAVIRMLPGRAGAPLRLIAVLYCDILRAVPALVVILLIVFGAPLVIPAVARIDPVYLGIIALSLTYSAYVAEVYRAGLTSIHYSQSAAARSLGLSYAQTLRKVLVPQAIRRVIPPLLNDFIGLQKDTALLLVAGIVEATGTAQLWQAKLFNLSPITLVALFFVVITLPQARFVDWLIARDGSRKAGG